ncbi:alkaline phosphatase [Bacteroidales bacterium OttesenSCG-928-M06]|nr:alkaline phosphatase [Bacteroidales bacterium OttesenSCG-928-M06]
MKKVNLLLLCFVLIITGCKASNSKELVKTVKKEPIKNVILLIGDGMGVAQIYAGMTANNNKLNLERSQYIGFSKTYSANDYVTDSAAGGTAIACGEKTNNGVIGLDVNGKPIQSLLKIAADNNLSTGIVVSCELTHATPASFIAHQPSRNLYKEIAADYMNVPFTVAIGGGRTHFEERDDKRNLTEELKEKGYQVAYTLDEIKNIKFGKMIGLMADGHPEAYPARGELLTEGVTSALDILSQNDKGFFLMVEGSMIDWGGHSNDTEMIINEMKDFDRAIKIAFDFADNNPGTLVVITADHETGGMALLGGDFSENIVKAKYTTGGHSGVMVPVFSYGVGAQIFSGIYENTDILGKILNLYGFSLDK